MRAEYSLLTVYSIRGEGGGGAVFMLNNFTDKHAHTNCTRTHIHAHKEKTSVANNSCLQNTVNWCENFLKAIKFHKETYAYKVHDTMELHRD